MEAAEDSFEADGRKFNPGTFILRDADRAQLEKAAAELGLHVHATNANLTVATHAISAPRVGLVHNWQNTQNDGWFRIAFDELKIPYTYVADTWLRENSNLREKFDVLILPPMGGGGPAGLSSELRGLPMRGDPRPWKNTADKKAAPNISEGASPAVEALVISVPNAIKEKGWDRHIPPRIHAAKLISSRSRSPQR